MKTMKKTKKTMEILFFHAHWCKSCSKMLPTVTEFAKTVDKSVLVTTVDVETEWGVDMSCKYEVRNVPTILVTKKGKIVERIKGLKTLDELKRVVERWK